MNTLQLIEEAARFCEKYELAEGKDQTWVVMDRNNFPQDDYDNAFNKAKAEGISVGFANECFEVWIHLHFAYSTAHIPRAKLPKLLCELLGVKYEKGMENLYEVLLPRQKQAISNAMQLLEHSKKTQTDGIHNCCPCTNLQYLVLELNKYS
jgi:hypothetical protein